MVVIFLNTNEMQSCIAGLTCLTTFIHQIWGTKQIYYACIPVIWWWIGAIAPFLEHFVSYIYQNNLLCSLPPPLSLFFPSILLPESYIPYLIIASGFQSASGFGCSPQSGTEAEQVQLHQPLCEKITTGACCPGMTQKMVHVFITSWLAFCKSWMLNHVFKIIALDPEYCGQSIVTRDHIFFFSFFTLLFYPPYTASLCILEYILKSVFLKAKSWK